MISFSPPHFCVAAFFGAINCVKSYGAELFATDDEGRTVAQFAAASTSSTTWLQFPALI
jgi:hypothetical protein